jgi:hypothetical protein
MHFKLQQFFVNNKFKVFIIKLNVLKMYLKYSYLYILQSR